MPLEGRTASKCKIRKRGCSSSSSSSLVRRYKLKRAILVGKKTGSSTPVPTWKTAMKSPSFMVPNAGIVVQSGGFGKEVQVPVSARKLAATLWEINEMPGSGGLEKDVEVGPDKKVAGRKEKGRRSVRSESLQLRLSDPSYSPAPETIEQLKGAKHCRRASTFSQKLQITDFVWGEQDSVSNASVLQIESHSHGKNYAGDMRARLKDVINSLTTSKELVKVLCRVGGLTKQHSSTLSIVSALFVELDRAFLDINQVIHEQKSRKNQVDILMQHFSEIKAAWKAKERERIHNSVAHLADELEVERKLRRQVERLNKKLGEELANTKVCLSKSLKELESERRAKEILEQVCDELARGIGEDRAQVEELKRESAKVLEEVEREREMLQLANVLREERVQMKLSEAKYHFEEKNAVVEKLKSELESLLSSKAGNGDGSPRSEKIKELEALLKSSHFESAANNKNFDSTATGYSVEIQGNAADGEDSDGDDSAESELHSIELNMDNATRSYKWSYAHEDDAKDDGAKRVSVDKDINGRRSLSEKIQWGSICLTKETSNGNNLDACPNNNENLNGFDRARLFEFISQALSKNNENEMRRYKNMKNPSKFSRIVPEQNIVSPIQQWSQSLPSQDSRKENWEASLSLPGYELKAGLIEIGSDCRIEAIRD